MADFNRDGVPDLAVLQLESGASRSCVLTVFTGNGDGTFRAASSVPIGSEASGIAAGDFNQDGAMDLAVSHASANLGTDVTILLGNGDGPFRTGATYTMSGVVRSIASADLNRDGRLDLAVANSQSITILAGNGDGTFRQQPDLPTFAAGQMLRVADMNGDGFPDLVLAAESNRLFLQTSIRKQEKRQVAADRLSKIADMNHHVRNALAVVAFYGTQGANAMATELVSSAIRRIEWTLREVLPRGWDLDASESPLRAGKRCPVKCVPAPTAPSDAAHFADLQPNLRTSPEI